MTVGLAAANAAYAGALCLLWCAEAAGPERWWWSTVNLYLPQWAWGLPALALALGWWLLARRPALAAAQSVFLLWVAGPMMGWNVPAARRSPPGPGETRLRVMTYNVQGGAGDLSAVARAVAAEGPDVLLLQEAGADDGGIDAALRAAFPERRFARAGEFLVVSRLPLSGAELVPLPRLADSPWKSPAYLRFVVRAGETGETPVAVYNVHFSTPRPALNALRDGEPGARRAVESNAAARLHQAAVVAGRVAAERGPVLLAGDLNAPPRSLLLRQLQSAGLRDAFAAAGSGYGYTAGHGVGPGVSYARVDHILTGGGAWRVLGCRAASASGPSGSDHRPVVADLALPPGLHGPGAAGTSEVPRTGGARGAAGRPRRPLALAGDTDAER